VADEADDLAIRRRWAETWRKAAPALEEIRRRELKLTDTQEAIRQIFGDGALPDLPPASATSGLVEQQALFARLRAKMKRQ